MAVVAGLAYLAAVLAALMFFGTRVQRALLSVLAPGAGMAIAFGIATYIALCGILEVGQWASRAILLGFVVLGAAGQSVVAFRHRRPVAGGLAMPAGAAILLAVFIILYAVFLVNAADWQYYFIDDLQGYLIYPERILAEGSLGRDPFNFRHIESGLTGNGGYLYALFRAALDLRQTRLADVGVGSACLLLLVDGHARAQGLSPTGRVVVLLLTLAAVMLSPIINNTPDTIGKALLLALLCLTFALDAEPPGWRQAGALGLLCFAVVALKTSYLPAAAAVMAASYLARLGRQRFVGLAAEAMLVVAVMIPLMLPWMVASDAVGKTLWYPLLGSGTLAPGETAGMAAPMQFLRDCGRLLVILAPAALGTLAAWRQPEWRSRRVFLLAVTLCSIATTVVSQLKFTVFGYRYGHAGAVALMLFFLPTLLRIRAAPLLRLAVPCVLAASLAVMAVSKVTPRRWLSDGWLGEIVYGPELNLPASWRDGQMQAAMRAMQAAVPAGQPMVVLLSWAPLLDFGRNPIAAIDHPGRMGPPGMPAEDDPAGWARYLAGLGFHYVAYSYGDEALFTKAWARHTIQRGSDPSSFSPYWVANDMAELQMRETFLAFRRLGQVVYDDGNEFVVRLPP